MPDNPPEPNFRNDPLYTQGMAHLQGGHWNDAAAAFEALSRKYGADPELARALEQARFKAQLDTLGRVRPRQITFPWRAWLARGVIVVLIAVLAVYGAGLLSERVAPAIARAQEDQQRANLVMQATSLVESENYDEAEIINIGRGSDISIRELAERIAKLSGFGGELRWDPSKPDGQPRRCLDTSRAKELLGWSARIPLDEGLRRTIAWYREHKVPGARRAESARI